MDKRWCACSFKIFFFSALSLKTCASLKKGDNFSPVSFCQSETAVRGGEKERDNCLKI